MSTYKRVDGDYNIVTINSDDNVIVETHTVEIRGNLDVVGNLTYINVSELNVKDPFILLNSSNTGSYAANAGMLTHIDSTTFAGIRYNSDSGNWELSKNTGTSGETGTWDAITTANTAIAAAGLSTQVQFNQSGVFGASENLTFDWTSNRFTISGTQNLSNIGTEPTAVANTVTIYHNAVGSGGTGVYAKTSTTNDELVSRSKAIVFGIIF